MIKRIALSLCLCAVVMTGGLSARQSVSVKLPPHSRSTLKNGLTLLLMEQHEVPIVSFNIIVKSGSVADPQGKEGLASLTAELIRKGTQTRTSEQISSELDFIGGEFSMNATTDYTTGSAEFLKKDVREGMGLMADIILGSTFPQAEVTKLIEQRIDGIKSAKDRADSVIGRYFSTYLYGKHPYARPVGGDERSLAALNRDDVLNFYKSEYAPGNTILAVAGDFNTAEMRSMVERLFDSWTAKMPVATKIADPAPVEGKHLLLVDKPDSTQTYFMIGNTGISRTNPDRVAIAVVNTIFGGRFTSRLNTALRVDSGLTYGARSTFDQRKLAGPFVISTYTKNSTTEQAIDMALKVLATLHEKGITEAELASTKAYMKGQFPPSIETTDELAGTIARLEFYGLDESDINSYFAKIDAVTIPETRRVIEKYFPKENLAFVLIGKASEIQSIAKKYAATSDMKAISQPGF